MFIFFVLFSYITSKEQLLGAIKPEISFLYAFVWNKVNFIKISEWNIEFLQVIWQFFLLMSKPPLLLFFLSRVTKTNQAFLDRTLTGLVSSHRAALEYFLEDISALCHHNRCDDHIYFLLSQVWWRLVPRFLICLILICLICLITQ